MKKHINSSWLYTMGMVLISAAALTFAGCDNKEKVLDIETPGGEVEVERDRDTGEVEVEVEKDD